MRLWDVTLPEPWPSMFGGRLGILGLAKRRLAASDHTLPSRKLRQSSGKKNPRDHRGRLNLNRQGVRISKIILKCEQF